MNYLAEGTTVNSLPIIPSSRLRLTTTAKFRIAKNLHTMSSLTGIRLPEQSTAVHESPYCQVLPWSAIIFNRNRVRSESSMLVLPDGICLPPFPDAIGCFCKLRGTAEVFFQRGAQRIEFPSPSWA
jgi:hypothetical protein